MEADEQLLAWAQEFLPDTELLLTSPTGKASQAAVYFYLWDLAAAPPLRGPDPAPLQLMARYLVCTWGTDPTQAHTLLNALIFHAMRHPLFEVDLEPIPLELWSGFQMMPQPAFVLCIPVVVVDPVPPVPIVLEPPTLTGVPLVALRGLVLGPDDFPLANARVEYPSLQRSATTDAQGEFTLSGLPAEPTTKALRIKTKGKIFDLAVEQPAGPEEVATIHVPLLN